MCWHIAWCPIITICWCVAKQTMYLGQCNHYRWLTPKPWIGAMALRIYVRTLIKGNINTLTKAIKLIPPLPHPILEDKPPPLNLVEVWWIGRQIPKLTVWLRYPILNALRVVKIGIIDDDRESWQHLRLINPTFCDRCSYRACLDQCLEYWQTGRSRHYQPSFVLCKPFLALLN